MCFPFDGGSFTGCWGDSYWYGTGGVAYGGYDGAYGSYVHASVQCPLVIFAETESWASAWPTGAYAAIEVRAGGTYLAWAELEVGYNNQIVQADYGINPEAIQEFGCSNGDAGISG